MYPVKLGGGTCPPNWRQYIKKKFFNIQAPSPTDRLCVRLSLSDSMLLKCVLWWFWLWECVKEKGRESAHVRLDHSEFDAAREHLGAERAARVDSDSICGQQIARRRAWRAERDDIQQRRRCWRRWGGRASQWPPNAYSQQQQPAQARRTSTAESRNAHSRVQNRWTPGKKRELFEGLFTQTLTQVTESS